MNIVRLMFTDRFALVRLFIGAALISLSGVFVKLVSVEPTVSGFWRVAFGGAILVTILSISRKPILSSGRSLFWITVAGFAFAVDLYVWHKSIIYIGVGLSTLLANFQVFVMAAAAVLVFGERMSRIQIIAIPMAIFGLYLIVGIDWSTFNSETKAGVWLGLATAVAYTVYMLSLRQARWAAPRRDAASDLALATVICAGFLAIVAAIEGHSLAIPTAGDVAWLVVYAFVGQVLGWLMISSSLPFVPTVHIGLALLLQPTLAYTWDVLIFKRDPGLLEITGASIAIFAIYLGSRRSPE